MPTGLSTRPAPFTRFSEPEDVLPTSAIRRGTGTHHELRRFLVLRRGVTTPSRAFTFVRPLAGTARADEPRKFMLPKERACWTGPTRAKVRVVFRRARPLLEPSPHTSFVVRALLWEAEPSTRCARTGCLVPRERGTSYRKDSGSRTVPRRAMRSTKTEVRSTVMRLCEPEDRSSCSPRWVSLHAAPVLRRAPTLCSLGEPAPL